MIVQDEIINSAVSSEEGQDAVDHRPSVTVISSFNLLDIGRKRVNSQTLGSHNDLPPVSTTSFPGSFGQFPRSSRAI